MDDLDVKVAEVVLLACSARRRSGYNETTLHEQVERLEKEN